jgi:3-hydroxyisobutyrate dehydrogenase
VKAKKKMSETHATEQQNVEGDDHSETSPPDLTGAGVAVIGTGTMGAAVARRLLSAGATVDVWNRSPQPTRELALLGARVHHDPHQAVTSASVVLTLLPTADVVHEVMVDRGVVDAMTHGAVWAQMGTVGVDAIADLGAAVAARRPDVRFIDAPVSGSQAPAEAGQLVVLASGPDVARGIVDPVFSVLGHRTLWLGATGAGTRMKLVLNTWLAFEIEAAAEASALASRLGIASGVLADAIAGSPLVSSFAAAKLAKMQAADDRPDFSLGWALKDLELAEAAAGTGSIPVAGAIARRWRGLTEWGFAVLDVSAARLGLDEVPSGEREQP